MKEPMNALDRWMKENRYSDPLFASLIKERTGRPVTARAVFKWRHKQRRPRYHSMAAIKEITGNAVTESDFAELVTETDH